MFVLLFVSCLFSCFVCLALYFVCSVFLYCFVYLSPNVFFPSICVQVYGPLPPGDNPIAVNRHHINHCHYCSFVAVSYCRPSITRNNSVTLYRWQNWHVICLLIAADCTPCLLDTSVLVDCRWLYTLQFTLSELLTLGPQKQENFRHAAACLCV